MTVGTGNFLKFVLQSFIFQELTWNDPDTCLKLTRVVISQRSTMSQGKCCEMQIFLGFEMLL